METLHNYGSRCHSPKTHSTESQNINGKQRKQYRNGSILKQIFRQSVVCAILCIPQ